MAGPRPSLEVIAPTVEQAVEQGAAEMGIPAADLEVEVLDEGSRGVLGVGARQARVRVSIRPAGAAAEGEDAPALRTARDVSEELLRRMGLTAQVASRWGDPPEADQPRPVWVDIRGRDLSLLIGRRGETLRAFQYLTRLILTRSLGESPLVIVDVEGYRARREEQLRSLARRMADQAIEAGRTMTLEPMPPHERRIIHLELRDHPRAYTESIGEGEQRKVTIVPRP
ncbi:MAG: RNA-binding cell elongation regulator Jag/EloR [Anaerolineales bacterium]